MFASPLGGLAGELSVAEGDGQRALFKDILYAIDTGSISTIDQRVREAGGFLGILQACE